MAWDSNEPSSVFGSDLPAPKSLFRNPSVSQVNHTVPLKMPDPAELRKMRPSQRRAYTQVDTTPQGQSQGTLSSNYSGISSSTENLETLRDMINSVGQSWGREQQISQPGRIVQVSTFDSRTASHVPGLKPRPLTSNAVITQYATEDTKPKLATTIKVRRESQDQLPNASKGHLSAVSKGKMLPPAVPIHRKNDESDTRLEEERRDSLTLPSASRSKDTSARKGQIMETDRSVRYDPTFEADLSESASPTSGTPSSSSVVVPSKYGTVNTPRGTRDSHARESSVPPKVQPRKVLGMRRTSSLNQQGTPPSSQTSTIIPAKVPTSRQLSQRPIHRTNSMERCTFQNTNKPSVPPLDTAPRPRTFKVPWAGGPLGGNNSITGSKNSSPTTVFSTSQSSGSGSDSAQTSAGDSGSRDIVEGSTLDHADSSYSFDDMDYDELNQVLSQVGA